MRSNIRVSGVEIVGNIPWGIHFCQFYQTKEDLLDILVPYFKAGLENNEFCMWITSEHLNAEEAKKALRIVIPYFDVYLDKGQIEFISYTDWYFKEGILNSEKIIGSLVEKIKRALAIGYEGIRTTESFCWLETENRSNFVNYEKKVDSITGRYPVITLCTYFLNACNVANILEIVANHQFVLSWKEGKWEKTDNSGRKSIVECKQTEKALQESEKRHRMLFTHMTDGFGLVEVIYNDNCIPYDYRYLEVNPAFEQYLGVDKEQILGRTMLEAFPNVSSIALEKFNEVAVSGQPVHFEIFSQIADTYLDVYVFGPEKGKLALIIRDITERKQIEEELQESEVKYRSIVETASEGIWVGGPEARAIYVNNRLTEMLGYTQDEMIGKFIWDFTSKEDKSVVKKKIERRRQGLDERYEFKFIRKDGSFLWTIVSSKPLFDSDRKYLGSISMLTDITGRKEAETKLKETLDNLENLVKERTAELEKAYNSLKESEKGLEEAQKMAHVGNWEWDIVTEESYWSDELDRIFGRDPQDPHPTYEEFLNYVHPSDREYVENATNRAINGKTYSIDYRIIRVDGEERTVHMRSEVIFDDKNTPVRLKGIIQDITERKKAEEALKIMEKIRIKEIHHRIKNNLQVISSLLDLQAETFSHLETCKTPEVVEAFTESQSRVISMALIHEELYTGDKIDTLDFSAYLRKLTAELFNSYKPGNKEISFKLNLEQVYLGMDTAIPLGIIVNELVSNSFKHAFPAEREGAICIILRKNKILASENETSAFRSDISDPGKECAGINDFHYILEVSDNGIGIPEEIDLDNSDSLGLQLVNILVEQIDGCIEIERDHGTKFTIWFSDVEK